MNSEIVEVEQSVAIHITEENQVSLEDSITLMLESLPTSTTTQCSIYRVHEKFRKLNQSSYTPEMICIVPFHRGNK
ncbi:hypothetical protein MKX03_015842, partial [Papaver bracteatum]